MKRALQALVLLAAAGTALAQGKPLLIEIPPSALPADLGADGSLIVGGVYNPFDPFDQSAWTWTPQGGVRCHPAPEVRLSKPYIAIMLATSEDGRVIGGAQSFGLDSEAVLWLDGEAVYLKDYLQGHGVPDAFRGWINTGFVTGVSRDGRMIVGQGAGPTAFQGYVVLFP